MHNDFKSEFFNFSLRQPVNQWLAIALLGLMCYWVVLYFFTHKTTAIADSYASYSSEATEL